MERGEARQDGVRSTFGLDLGHPNTLGRSYDGHMLKISGSGRPRGSEMTGF